MAGVALMVLVLVVVFPVVFLMSMTVVAALLGWLTQTDVEAAHEGTEYIDLGR